MKPGRAPFMTVRELRKEFPGVLALDGVSLAIAPGDVIGLVGKNGAGKSTLIKAMAGVVQPDSGAIEIDGEPASITTPHDATLARLAFVHQELAHAPNLSVAENVMLGLGYPRLGPLVRWRALRRRAGEILDRLDAGVSPQAVVGDLSPAQQRLVMIAHALAQNARLVVLDEPSAALTDQEIEQLHAVVARLAADGVAVVYISHRLEEILKVTSRVVVMRDGQVVGERATETLAHDELVRLITGSATEITKDRSERSRAAPTRDGEPVLSVVGLSVDGTVHDVSFEVHAGEVLGFAGLVGSGRTELVRAVFGADARRAGEIFVEGRRADVAGPADAIDAGIVLLPEERRREGNVLDFSVQRNLTLVTLGRHRFLSRLGVPSRRSERRAATEQIRELRIATAGPDTEVRWLSGGNQQKVMLGKWLARGADVYIFDEPTQGIDVEAKEEAFALIDALAVQGKGAVLISSDFTELVAMCDRVLILREGRIVAELRNGEITESALVEGCYAVA